VANRASLKKRVAFLEEQGVAHGRVEMYIEGPRDQHWLTMCDGTEYTGEEAKRIAATIDWSEYTEGITHMVGVDLDVVLGRKPAPDDEADDAIISEGPALAGEG
jgi:hypothetical protein